MRRIRQPSHAALAGFTRRRRRSEAKAPHGRLRRSFEPTCETAAGCAHLSRLRGVLHRDLRVKSAKSAAKVRRPALSSARRYIARFAYWIFATCAGRRSCGGKRSFRIAGVAHHQEAMPPFGLTFLLPCKTGLFVRSDCASIFGAWIGPDSGRSPLFECGRMRSYERRTMTDHVGFADELVDASRSWR